MPKYIFADLVSACTDNQNDVIPLKQALMDADTIFGLKTKQALLAFISNGGLEDLSFENTKEWENNPDKSHSIVVDAYEFRSMCKLGYIAFMYNDITRKWIIKSFHLSMNRNNAIGLALIKAGLIGDKS
jgi:hypothetical protein